MTKRKDRPTMESMCHIKLPKELYARVWGLCQTEETTVSQYVVEIVELFLRSQRSGVPVPRDEGAYLNRDDDGVDGSIYL